VGGANFGRGIRLWRHGGGYWEGVFDVMRGEVITIVMGAGGTKGTSAGAGANTQAEGSSSFGTGNSATGGGGSGYSGYAATPSDVVGAGSSGQINQLGQQAANSYLICLRLYRLGRRRRL
jgi:hypothetical protein